MMAREREYDGKRENRMAREREYYGQIERI